MFESTLRAVGGTEGIKRCFLAGNTAPLELVLKAAEDELKHVKTRIRQVENEIRDLEKQIEDIEDSAWEKSEY